MPLDSYSGLQQEALDWVDDGTLAGAKVQSFIALAEAEMRDRLLIGRAEILAELAAPAGADLVALPADCGSVVSLSISGDPSRALRFIDGQEFNRVIGAELLAGPPRFYTIEAGKLRLGPTPDATGRVRITYNRDLPGLSAATPSNWLLARYPQAYLNGALKYASLFLVEDTRAEGFDALFKQALDGIVEADARRRTGPRPRMAFRPLA